MIRHRKLKTIAKWVNENHGDKFRATVGKSWSNTDRKISGTRLRHPGKGRDGFLLIITNLKTDYKFTHDSSETYRNNQEVEDWIKKNIS